MSLLGHHGHRLPLDEETDFEELSLSRSGWSVVGVGTRLARSRSFQCSGPVYPRQVSAQFVRWEPISLSRTRQQEAACAHVTTGAGSTYSATGADCTHATTTGGASKTSALTNLGDADSAGRGTPISTASTMSACATWRTGAVLKLSEVWGAQGPSGSQRLSQRLATSFNL